MFFLRKADASGARLLAGAASVAAMLCAAQVQPAPRPPDGGTREVLISILIPSLANAPFSATVNTEWVRQLPDGSTITLVNHRAIARDRAGRIFQERRLLVPEDGKTESVVTQTEISDPVAHRLYICVPRQQVCQVEIFTAPAFVPPATTETASTTRPASAANVENLGRQSMAGLETIGLRQTETIEAGAIGNNVPLSIVREFWYSTQLGVNVLSKIQDPRFGIQRFELSGINPSDPDATLFRVPENSRIIDLRKAESAAWPH